MNTNSENERLERAVESALNLAFLDAVEIGRRTGTGVWIWKDGHPVNLLAEPTISYRETETDEIKEAPLVREPPAEEE